MPRTCWSRWVVSTRPLPSWSVPPGSTRCRLDRFQVLSKHDERLAFAHYYEGLSHLYLGKAEEALTALGHARSAGGKSAEIAAARACALVAAGREGEARGLLRALTGDEDGLYVSPVRLAQVHAALGESEAALDRLGEAIEKRAADMIWVNVFPAFRAVREEPGYETIRELVFGAAR
jgi:tetratricopeptide (TPR) repeat protein